MKFKKLSKQLENIGNNFSWINAGGCGEFALMLGNKLRQNNVKFKYVLITENGLPLLSSQREFNNLGDNINNKYTRDDSGFTICHIMVYCNGRFLDSEGVHKDLNKTRWFGKYGYNLGAILSQDILQTWCKQDTWNSMFDRDQLPRIEQQINGLVL